MTATRNYETNLLNLRSLIENSIETWGMMPTSACNHIYNKLAKDEKPGDDIAIQRTVDDDEPEIENPEDYEEDELGSDLDVPGSELDDQQESIGSEDEENNFYSIGGDNHNDLEEEHGS